MLEILTRFELEGLCFAFDKIISTSNNELLNSENKENKLETISKQSDVNTIAENIFTNGERSVILSNGHVILLVN